MPSPLDTLRNAIAAVPWTNGTRAITGAAMLAILTAVVGLVSTIGTWDSSGTFTPNIPAGTITQPMLASGVGGGVQPGAPVDTNTVKGRTNSDRATEANVLLDGGQGLSDWTSAINAALANNVPLRLPLSASPYHVSGRINLGAGQTLRCDPGTTIIQDSANQQTLGTTGAGASIENCLISGGGIALVASQPNVSWIGGGADSTSGIFVRSDHFRLSRTAWSKGKGTAVSIDAAAATDFDISNNEFENNVGFGVWVTNGAGQGKIIGNWTNSNGIELVGITYTGHDVEVIGNRGQGTGDNCFSFSGYRITATGNEARGCAFTGIYSYGEFNTITGNHSSNNGQVHNPNFQVLVGPTLSAGSGYNASNTNLYAGISGRGGFGGTGQDSVIVGNTVDDDQSTMTQDYGISWGAGYASWLASTSYYKGDYFYASGNIYKVLTAGTSGTTAPTSTSSSFADGTATVQFIQATSRTTRESAGNVISGNRIVRYKTSAYNDATTNKNNLLCTDSGCQFWAGDGITSSVYDVRARAKKVGTNWTSGQTYAWGRLVYTNNGNNLYRQVSPSGSCVSSTQPSHTSGIVSSADSCSWLFLTTGPYFTQQDIADAGYTFNQPLNVGVAESLGTSIQILSGNGPPDNKVNCLTRCLYIRADGGPNTTLYVSESSGTIGWAAK